MRKRNSVGVFDSRKGREDLPLPETLGRWRKGTPRLVELPSRGKSREPEDEVVKLTPDDRLTTEGWIFATGFPAGESLSFHPKASLGGAAVFSQFPRCSFKVHAAPFDLAGKFKLTWS